LDAGRSSVSFGAEADGGTLMTAAPLAVISTAAARSMRRLWLFDIEHPPVKRDFPRKVLHPARDPVKRKFQEV
jgi:hypothetical protein